MQVIGSSLSEKLADKLTATLFGMFVFDATAMPVHWIYDLRELKRDYGQIKGYVKPLDLRDNSIMNLSNTGGGGRGGFQGSIVGDVILHGKKKYWARGKSFNYHVGLQAGENTLENQLLRELIRGINKDGDFIADNFRENYMKFMTTEGSHNDAYASTCHRMFFKNLKAGKNPKDCPDNDNHNVDTLDAITLSVPVILQNLNAEKKIRDQKVIEAIKVTRGIKGKTSQYATIFSDYLVDVINGKDLRTATSDISEKIGMKLNKQMMGQSDPMSACYIDSNFPTMLFLNYKYADNLEKACLANANAGGENVARGSLMGALFGATYGMKGFPEWTKKLYDQEAITKEIDGFVKNYFN